MGTEQNCKELEKKIGEALKIQKRPVAVAEASPREVQRLAGTARYWVWAAWATAFIRGLGEEEMYISARQGFACGGRCAPESSPAPTQHAMNMPTGGGSNWQRFRGDLFL
jgi:hypothetical protein